VSRFFSRISLAERWSFSGLWEEFAARKASSLPHDKLLTRNKLALLAGHFRRFWAGKPEFQIAIGAPSENGTCGWATAGGRAPA
jgi:hypothetical protein